MAEAVTFLAGARDVLLGVLAVTLVAKKILDTVKEVFKAAEEVVVAAGELVVAVRALFQDAQWTRWAQNIRSDLQCIDSSIPFEFFDLDWSLGIVRKIQLIVVSDDSRTRVPTTFPATFDPQ